MCRPVLPGSRRGLAEPETPARDSRPEVVSHTLGEVPHGPAAGSAAEGRTSLSSPEGAERGPTGTYPMVGLMLWSKWSCTNRHTMLDFPTPVS